MPISWGAHHADYVLTSFIRLDKTSIRTYFPGCEEYGKTC